MILNGKQIALSLSFPVSNRQSVTIADTHDKIRGNSEILGTAGHQIQRKRSTGQLRDAFSVRSGRNFGLAHNKRGAAPSERARIALEGL